MDILLVMFYVITNIFGTSNRLVDTICFVFFLSCHKNIFLEKAKMYFYSGIGISSEAQKWGFAS